MITLGVATLQDLTRIKNGKTHSFGHCCTDDLLTRSLKTMSGFLIHRRLFRTVYPSFFFWYTALTPFQKYRKEIATLKGALSALRPFHIAKQMLQHTNPYSSNNLRVQPSVATILCQRLDWRRNSSKFSQAFRIKQTLPSIISSRISSSPD